MRSRLARKLEERSKRYIVHRNKDKGKGGSPVSQALIAPREMRQGELRTRMFNRLPHPGGRFPVRQLARLRIQPDLETRSFQLPQGAGSFSHRSIMRVGAVKVKGNSRKEVDKGLGN